MPSYPRFDMASFFGLFMAEDLAMRRYFRLMSTLREASGPTVYGCSHRRKKINRLHARVAARARHKRRNRP